MTTVTRKVRFDRGRHGKRAVSGAPPQPNGEHIGRVPRVARLMALAIRFDGIIREGVVTDQSELARLTAILHQLSSRDARAD